MIGLVDIDGTCADWTDRAKRAGNCPEKRTRANMQDWLDRLQNAATLMSDRPILPVRAILKGLAKQRGIKLIYLTGRDEEWRDVTVRWLKRNGFPKGELLMRDSVDKSTPFRCKSKHIKQLQKDYPGEAFFTLDDDHRGDCQKMYKNRGILHLKVMA